MERKERNGSSDLARETGYTPGYISQQFKAGKTADQLREQARRRAERMESKGTAPPPRPPPIIPTTAAQMLPKPYVPSYRDAPAARPGGRVGMLPIAVPVPPLPSLPLSAVRLNFRDDIDSDPADESYPDAQRRKEIALANERELRVSVMRKDLVPKQELESWYSGLVVKARDILLRIGPELRDRLAACVDPVKCEGMVDDEVRRALTTLCTVSAESIAPMSMPAAVSE